MMPSQNDGVAMPAIATVRTIWSSQLFWCSAEIVPSGMAISTATRVASRAISSDTGTRVAISWLTGLPDHIDVPKSPRANPAMKSKNCSTSERSRPSWAWQLATAVGLIEPPEPSRTTQMSPGIRRIRMNTSAAAPIRVGIDSNRRFRM